MGKGLHGDAHILLSSSHFISTDVAYALFSVCASFINEAPGLFGQLAVVFASLFQVAVAPGWFVQDDLC